MSSDVGLIILFFIIINNNLLWLCIILVHLVKIMIVMLLFTILLSMEKSCMKVYSKYFLYYTKKNKKCIGQLNDLFYPPMGISYGLEWHEGE